MLFDKDGLLQQSNELFNPAIRRQTRKSNPFSNAISNRMNKISGQNQQQPEQQQSELMSTDQISNHVNPMIRNIHFNSRF